MARPTITKPLGNNWAVDVVVENKVVRVSCGTGGQCVRWLGHAAVSRCGGGVPTCVHRADGSLVDLGAVINEVIRNGETLFVTASPPH